MGRISRTAERLYQRRRKVPTLQLDSDLMVQLLMNLLTNSLQATERGGRIKVIVEPFPRRDGVVLGVSDTGAGTRVMALLPDAQAAQETLDGAAAAG